MCVIYDSFWCLYIYIYISMCVCVSFYPDVILTSRSFDLTLIFMFVVCRTGVSLFRQVCACVFVNFIVIQRSFWFRAHRHLCWIDISALMRENMCVDMMLCVCVCVSSSFPFVWVLVNSKSTTNPHTWYVLHVGKLEIASQSEPRYRFDSCMSSKFDLSSRKWHAVSRSTG